MIFVTIGTHEQPFDRLVREVDRLKGEGKITENVFIQIGYANYIPQFCEYAKIISYVEILKKVEAARIVITHGGPGSIMPVIYRGKIPIVVPRKKEFSEHVDNHQVLFTKMFAKKKLFIPLYEIAELERTIISYPALVNELKVNIKENNRIEENLKKYAQIIEEECHRLLEGKKK